MFGAAGDGVTYLVPPYQTRWTKLTVAEQKAALARKPPSLLPPADTRTGTERISDRAASVPASTQLQLTATLGDSEDVGILLRNLDVAGRQRAILQREQRLAPGQAALESELTKLGASNFARFWNNNSVTFSIPAISAAAALRLSGVQRWSLSDPEATMEPDQILYGDAGTAVWSQNVVRAQLGLDAFIAAGFRGQAGSALGANIPVRAAVVETQTPLPDGGVDSLNWISWNHPGLVTGRLLNARLCIDTGCSEVGGLLPDVSSHGTAVTSVLAGSIEGSATQYPGNLPEQIRRSGPATGATMHYYLAGGAVRLRRAILDAIALGADVLNYSAHASPLCGGGVPGVDLDDVRSAVRDALNVGMLVVASAGNSQHASPSCSLGFPALLPETLAVGGYDSKDEALNLQAVGSQQMTARGGVPMRTHYGSYGTYAGVDVMAPIKQRSAYANPGLTADPYFSVSGTSFSAPTTAAAAILLKQAVRASYGANLGGKELIPQMLVMADSFNHVTDSAADTYAYAGMNPVSGAGRLRMRLPRNDQFTGPWGWGWGWFDMSNGDVHVGELSATFQHHRYALTWYGENTDNLSDIEVESYKVCGGVETLVGWHGDFDVRKRLHTRAVNVPAGCSLRIKVVAVSIPPGQTVRIHDAWLWHNEVLP
ncbi:MAG: S8/S53 family peptidase [Myxococcales bacterium]|nr:S8/S53 family peptidase [Myxococcales bacterium]